MSDPFPAPILPLSQFPRLAPLLGITDVYGACLAFMAGILGLRRHSDRPPQATEGLDLSGIIARDGIRAHAGLYSGGEFVPNEDGFAEARRLVEAADTVFSSISSVLDRVPGVTPIDPALTDTAFFTKTSRDFAERPLQLLFVDDVKPRKGLRVVLEAIGEFLGEPVHLHVVGLHDPHECVVISDRTTLHGRLEPEELRALHQRSHIFLSPATPASPDDRSGDGGVVDGFPTAAAVEAVSSGLLLITGNPEGEHSQLRPGIDHIEVPATAQAFADAVRLVLADPATAASIADSGSRRVRERLDVRVGAAARLALMGFEPGRTPYQPPVPSTIRRDRGRGLAARWRPSSASEREVRQPAAVNQLAIQLRMLSTSLSEIQAEQHRLADEVRAMRGELMAVGQLELDDESATWRVLEAARAEPEYETPFTQADPLVSVCIPTYTNQRQLFERSIPSALAQDHPNIEVVVVGDAAPPETAAGIRRLGDPRVRYENLARRGPYPDDPQKRWLVAGTGPLNHALSLARGAWIAVNNDDDELRPNHVSTLLSQARESRDEVVYGRLMLHAPDGSTETIGTFPPVLGGFGWQTALQHRAMRLFEFKLSAALFGEPGDWNRARRMLRAGVRFRMIDDVLCDYYPGRLWAVE
jgi:glycosyltransferase involved in cell wall biosynthesis